MVKRSGKKSKAKKRSKCNSHRKSRTCPKTKCSWIKGHKNSNGQRVKGHCKGKGSKKKSKKNSPAKKPKKVSNCKGKKSSPCKRSKKCNWTKAHRNKNGLNIKGFCKSNPHHTKTTKTTKSNLDIPVDDEELIYMGESDGDDISSSSSSSSSGLSLNIDTPPGSAGQLMNQRQLPQNQLMAYNGPSGLAHGNPIGNNNPLAGNGLTNPFPGNGLADALILKKLLE